MTTVFSKKHFFKRLSILLGIISMSFNTLSQTDENSSAKIVSNSINADINFDLPPDIILQHKFQPDLDLNYKLNSSSNNKYIIPSSLDFWVRWQEEDLHVIDFSVIENKNYYSRLETFYNTISDDVKSIFSLSELIYIFIYDKSLMNELITL